MLFRSNDPGGGVELFYQPGIGGWKVESFSRGSRFVNALCQLMNGIGRGQGRQGYVEMPSRVDLGLHQANLFGGQLGFVLRRHVVLMLDVQRSEEHSSELQSLMLISFSV